MIARLLGCLSYCSLENYYETVLALERRNENFSKFYPKLRLISNQSAAEEVRKSI